MNTDRSDNYNINVYNEQEQVLSKEKVILKSPRPLIQLGDIGEEVTISNAPSSNNALRPKRSPPPVLLSAALCVALVS